MLKSCTLNNQYGISKSIDVISKSIDVNTKNTVY